MDVLDSVITSDTHTILLRPRPFARAAGRLVLLPLLPHRHATKPLPAEVWERVLRYVFAQYEECLPNIDVETWKQGLLLICKDLKDVALPLYYENVHVNALYRLERFTNVVYAADQRWDSIRRTPYSAPGRWVQTLDLSDLRCGLWSEVYHVDTLLVRLLPLLPFLAELILNSTILISRRFIDGLCNREGNDKLVSLKGVKLASSADLTLDDPFISVLRCCRNLVELEIHGSGIEPLLSDGHIQPTEWDHVSFKPLQLPQLRRLAVISMHCSTVFVALLHSALPSLRHLTVTPYDDIPIPSSLVPRFIETHGAELTSLHLFTPKSWPTMLFPSPTTLLQTCPKLNHLSLENPLPVLALSSTRPQHSLQLLSIPRPDAGFYKILEALLPKMPALKAVRARDVRWLRAGMSSHAREAGVQGEMRDWRQRLARRRIVMLDGAWQPGEI
ncbi:hypothetical protein PHLGIDRAFT_125747 [Phlebiopsis gigantea 11061_1 CR5-6]|uniref:F-box domain-containing protein n=1 Tax=Phlebiopsis gigantea (strain 11061_1 CR5-6) TaxID=745531 RepID=A0A0C3PRW7_PHLG1|nr:hypothetical protein PHLGIDRAFT_125747 [Phlebiopsis gigantea 11061_1 CR5-6]